MCFSITNCVSFFFLFFFSRQINFLVFPVAIKLKNIRMISCKPGDFLYRQDNETALS